MKRITLFVVTATVAVVFAACGTPPVPNNAKADTKPNAPKPTAAAPTAEALLALDRQANEAYINGNSTFFQGLLSDKFVMREGGQRMDKAAVVEMIAGVKCDVETWNLDESQMAKIDADTYVLIYRVTWNGTCTEPNGKSMKIPSPTRAATVWVRSGDTWQATFHGENLIIDPNNLPKAAPAPPALPADKNDQTKPVAPTLDPSTDALVAIEQSVWEAWKAKDAKKLEELTTKDLSFVDLLGAWTSGQANVIKGWTDVKCEGITKVSVIDGVASPISPTVQILTHKGTADGTCYGQEFGAVYGNSVYLKEGDAWKLAFTMNMPTM